MSSRNILPWSPREKQQIAGTLSVLLSTKSFFSALLAVQKCLNRKRQNKGCLPPTIHSDHSKCLKLYINQFGCLKKLLLSLIQIWIQWISTSDTTSRRNKEHSNMCHKRMKHYACLNRRWEIFNNLSLDKASHFYWMNLLSYFLHNGRTINRLLFDMCCREAVDYLLTENQAMLDLEKFIDRFCYDLVKQASGLKYLSIITIS